MSKNNVRGQEQKSFVRLFDAISNRVGRWEKWNDLVMLLAIEISNAVDHRHVAARGEYLTDYSIEGIVFWLDGVPRCKIKRTDFGLEWPISRIAD